MSGYISSGRPKPVVWTPRERLNIELATTGTPAWSHGNDQFAKLLLSGASLSDVSEGSPVHPYYPRTGYFDGASYLYGSTGTDFNIGAGNFVLKGWFNTTSSAAAYQTIFSCDGGYLDFRPDTGSFRFNYNGVSTCSWTTAVITINTWYHFAVARSGANVRLYLNGTLVSSVTAPGTFANSTTFYVGQNFSTNYLTGYLADICWKSGTDDGYTGATISVPISPLVADTYTKLHLPMNEGAKPIAYDKTKQKSVAVGSSTSIRNSFYGQKTIYFDNTANSQIKVANSTDFDFGSGDFTIEGWIKPINVPSTYGIVLTKATYAEYSPFQLVYNYTGTFQVYFSSNGTSWNVGNTTTAGTYALDTWHHYAIVRSGNSIKLYINGVTAVSITTSASLYSGTSGGFSQGMFYDVNNFWKFELAWTHIIKGYALYTTEFTPIQNPVIHPYTKLCIVAGDSATAFTDYSSSARIITTSGTARQTNKLLTASGVTFVPDTTCPISGRVMNFSGSSSYLALPPSADTEFGTDDFTIDCWINPWTIASIPFIASKWSTTLDTNRAWLLYLNAGVPSFQIHDGSNIYTVAGTTTVTTSTWYHIAVTRQNGTIRVFLNGVLQSSGYHPTIRPLPSDVVSLGNIYYFSGKMTQVRISKGIARWTRNFTQPTQEYTNGL